MTPKEQGEAHALLVRVVTDPDWQAAEAGLGRADGQAAGDASAAGGRGAPPHARAAGRLDVSAAVAQALYLITGPPVRAVSCLAPRAGAARSNLQAGRGRTWAHCDGYIWHGA